MKTAAVQNKKGDMQSMSEASAMYYLILSTSSWTAYLLLFIFLNVI